VPWDHSRQSSLNALGKRLAYVYRYYPNERAHPGSELASIGAEAAARQGRFWDMHDAIYDLDPKVFGKVALLEIARSLGLDLQRFEHDLAIRNCGNGCRRT
jgi:predicted DsbA family dithiol-disulfide isomerase